MLHPVIFATARLYIAKIMHSASEHPDMSKLLMSEYAHSSSRPEGSYQGEPWVSHDCLDRRMRSRMVTAATATQTHFLPNRATVSMQSEGYTTGRGCKCQAHHQDSSHVKICALQVQTFSRLPAHHTGAAVLCDHRTAWSRLMEDKHMVCAPSFPQLTSFLPRYLRQSRKISLLHSA